MNTNANAAADRASVISSNSWQRAEDLNFGPLDYEAKKFRYRGFVPRWTKAAFYKLFVGRDTRIPKGMLAISTNG